MLEQEKHTQVGLAACLPASVACLTLPDPSSSTRGFPLAEFFAAVRTGTAPAASTDRRSALVLPSKTLVIARETSERHTREFDHLERVGQQ
jgi:hypothetical protein